MLNIFNSINYDETITLKNVFCRAAGALHQ